MGILRYLPWKQPADPSAIATAAMRLPRKATLFRKLSHSPLCGSRRTLQSGVNLVAAPNV